MAAPREVLRATDENDATKYAIPFARTKQGKDIINTTVGEPY